jgi:hypothetical protein
VTAYEAALAEHQDPHVLLDHYVVVRVVDVDLADS